MARPGGNPDLGGGAPEGHPRACQGRSRVTGKPCGRWALKGQTACKFHGGRTAAARTSGLPGFYLRRLGPTLRDKVKELMEQPHHKQINLYEELALTRTCAAEAVSLAGAALDPQNGAQVSDSTKQLAISLMHDALARVKEFVVAASKIESVSTERVSVGVVDLFVLQVLRAVYRVCGKDNEDIAVRIEEEVARSVKLPFQGTDPNVTLEGPT